MGQKKERSIPKHYYSGLSKSNTKKQLLEIKKSRKGYKNHKYYIRSRMSSFKNGKEKKSQHIIEFEKKYNVKINDLKAVQKITGVPIPALKKVISKGMGAYHSSGSRPNQTPHSWAYARLASFLLKHGAYKIDKHVLDEFNAKIKPPPIKSKTQKLKGGTKMPDCCQINNNNESKYRACYVLKPKKRTFNLPRKYKRSQCNIFFKSNKMGFTQKASCTPYKNC